jgi:hypothetical protein
MKTKILLLILIAIILTSCATASPQPALESSIPSTQEISTATPSSINGFVEPDPSTWVMLMPAVDEYFYYRKQAMIANDVEVLWAHYPELRNDVNISKGINAEGFLISSYQGLKLFDGNIFPEDYERIRVKLAGAKAEVLVHGLELYLFRDENGNFQDSGGEIWIDLYMTRLGNNRWYVYKTDAVTDAEYSQFSP